MGQIPINSIVTVNISISPTFPERAGFGTLLCITKETGVLGLANRTRHYGDLDGVKADWGDNSEVTKVASTYFSQSPKPTEFMVGIRFETDQSAELIGGGVPETQLSVLQAVTDGKLKISLDGAEEIFSNINLSTATTMEEVAGLIQTALRTVVTGGFAAATCTYTNYSFVINSGTTGVTSLISYATVDAGGTDLSDLLKLQQGQAVRADGIAGETIGASLDALEESDSSWYGFAFTKEVRDDVLVATEKAVEKAADWAETKIKVFFTTTNNELTLNSNITTDISSVLKAKDLNRVLVVYSSKPTEYPEVSVAGRAFSVDFSAGNPSITLKFKKLPTITVESLSANQKKALDGKNCNALVSIAGNTMFAEGTVINGRFFDEIHGLDWLQNVIETNVFGALYTSNKISYTDKGAQKLVQQTNNSLAEGVKANLLAPGEDNEGNLLTEGYEVTALPVAQVPGEDKITRIYKGISFKALGAGAIHGVVINGIFES